MKTKQKIQFEFYLANQDKLVLQYNGKFIILQDNVVVDKFDTFDAAYHYALENLELGTYIIQLCTPGSEAYTQTFHSRVVFA